MAFKRTPKKPVRGVFITFEGIEGSGKTTQLARLAKHLRDQDYRVVETREPGGTPFAERIRELLLGVPMSAKQGTRSPVERLAPACEAGLVLAGRSQHVGVVIDPALNEGAVVLCDRFSDSTLAYQGYARGLSVRRLQDMNRFATGGLAPDLTLLFDLPVSVGLARRRREGTAQNRLDNETERFHRRVRQGFLDLHARYPRRIRRLDGRQAPDLLADQVRVIVDNFLKRRLGGR